MLGFIAHGADEPRAALALQRKHGEKIGVVERDVHLAVHHRAARLDVRDIEQVRIGAAGKAGAQRFADARVRAVAAGEIRGGTVSRVRRRASDARHALAVSSKPTTSVCRSTADARGGQPLDEQPLVLVLREDQRERIRAEAGAHLAEYARAARRPAHPQIHGGDSSPRSTTASASPI